MKGNRCSEGSRTHSTEQLRDSAAEHYRTETGHTWRPRQTGPLNLLTKGLIAFPGSGITENLVDKARQIGIPVYRDPDIVNPGAFVYIVHLTEDPRGWVRVRARSRIRDIAQRRVDTHPLL